MSNKKKRIDTTSEPEALSSNPFAGLAEKLSGDLPQHKEAPSSGTDVGERPLEGEPAFRVQRTRKGGYPIFLEKRPNGKVVTVVRNVTGDLDALLKLLKKRCGTGGHATEDAIEIQGDHRERVEGFLREKGG